MSKRSNTSVLVASTGLAVGDATKALIAAPGDGLAIRVFSVFASIVTAAAQQVYVGVNAGGITQQILSIPASTTFPVSYSSEEGFLLPANTALSAKPAAAGPAIAFVCEYRIEPV